MSVNDNISSGVAEDLSMISSEETETQEAKNEETSNLEGGKPMNLSQVADSDLGSLFESTEGSPSQAVSAFVPEDIGDLKQMRADEITRRGTEGSREGGNFDIDLDQGRGRGGRDSNRARNQNESIKGIKAIGGGIMQGGLIFLEQLGYAADLDTYTNLFAEVEDFSGNNWTRLMKETQDELRQSETFKIYEDTPDSNSLASEIFKWTSLEGAVSSAVGFGLSGLAASSFVSTMGSLGKFNKLGQMLDTTLGKMAGGASMAGKTASITGPLATSITSNYLMAQMMAADTYKASFEELQKANMIGTGEGQITEVEAQAIAAGNAQDVVGLNMALTATAFLKFGSLFKPDKVTGLISNPAAMAKMKEMIVKGSPTAFTENVYQEMIQMEQIHDTQVEAGRDPNDLPESTNLWDRIGQLALSTRAIHAGALGITGGPIQFATIQMPSYLKTRKEQMELYKDQTDSRDYQKEVLKNDMKDFQDLETATMKAVEAGDMDAVALIKDLSMAQELVKAVEKGTVAAFKEDLVAVTKMTAEEAAQEGYADGYVQKAEEALSKVAEVESILPQLAGKENLGALVYNRIASQRTLEKVDEIDGRNANRKQKLVERIQKIEGLENITLNNKLEIIQSKEAKAALGKMTREEQAAVRKIQVSQENSLNEFLESNREYQDYTKDSEQAKLLTKLGKDLFSQFEYLYSDKGQAEFKNSQEEARADMHKTSAEKKATEENESSGEKSDIFDSFAEVKRRAPKHTTEEQAEVTKAQDETTDTVNNAVINDTTFTATDNKKVARLYSVGDLVRNHEGQLFEVDAQNFASAMKGDLKYTKMPVLVERNSKGKAFKGAKKFELRDNTWLRPEVLQKTGTFHNSKNKWMTYVETDSVLRPNNLADQQSKQKYADLGLVKTVNNFEHKQVKGAEFLEKTEFGKKYATDIFNNPFSEEYEVTFQLRQEGAGKNFIDVYKKNAEGKDILLTRLDRNNNLNHDALATALTKGKVAGRVTEHYSNGNNIVTVADSKGNKIYRPLSDFSKMDKSRLPGGKVYLAQKTNEYSKDGAIKSVQVATSIDGDVNMTGGIAIEQNGVMVDVPIPYGSMYAGDTYVLMVSPAGRIVPMPLSTKPISESSSISGKNHKTIAGDITDAAQKTINEFYADNLENWGDTVKAVRDKSRASNKTTTENVAAEDLTYTERRELEEELGLFNTRNELQDKLAGTAYSYVKKGLVYESEIDENNEYVANKEYRDGKMRNVYHKNYFKIVAAVDSKGKIVPAVEVRDPINRTKTKRYNISDVATRTDGVVSQYNYHEILGGKLRRISIDHLVSPESYESATGADFMKELWESQDLQTDINIEQPFSGSSATIQIIGDDVIAEGAKAADAQRERLNQKFKVTSDKISEENLEDFDESMEEFLDPDAENNAVNSLYDLSDESVQTTIEYGRAMINTFDISDIAKADKMLLDIINTKPEDFTEDQEQAWEEALEYTEEVDSSLEGMEKENLAKLHMFTKAIQTAVAEKELGLKFKVSQGHSDPAGLATQAEGATFLKDSQVFHKLLGLVDIAKSLKDGYYYVKKGNKPLVKAYANMVFRKNGKYHKLAKLKEELSAEEKKSNKSEAVIATKQRKINALENDIKKSETAKKKSEAKEDSPGAEGVASIGIMEQYAELGATEKMLAIAEEFGATDRTAEIDESLTELINTIDDFGTGENAADSKYSTKANQTTETAKAQRASMLASIPYTYDSLSNLITLTEGIMKVKAEETTEYKEAVAAKLLFEGMRELQRSIEENLDSTDELTVRASTGPKGFKIGFQLPANKEPHAQAYEEFIKLSKAIMRTINEESKIRTADFAPGNKKTAVPAEETATKETGKGKKKAPVVVPLEFELTETSEIEGKEKGKRKPGKPKQKREPLTTNTKSKDTVKQEAEIKAETVAEVIKLNNLTQEQAESVEEHISDMALVTPDMNTVEVAQDFIDNMGYSNKKEVKPARALVHKLINAFDTLLESKDSPFALMESSTGEDIGPLLDTIEDYFQDIASIETKLATAGYKLSNKMFVEAERIVHFVEAPNGANIAFYETSANTSGKGNGFHALFGKADSWYIKGSTKDMQENYNSSAIKEVLDIVNSVRKKSGTFKTAHKGYSSLLKFHEGLTNLVEKGSLLGAVEFNKMMGMEEVDALHVSGMSRDEAVKNKVGESVLEGIKTSDEKKAIRNLVERDRTPEEVVKFIKIAQDKIDILAELQQYGKTFGEVNTALADMHKAATTTEEYKKPNRLMDMLSPLVSSENLGDTLQEEMDNLETFKKEFPTKKKKFTKREIVDLKTKYAVEDAIEVTDYIFTEDQKEALLEELEDNDKSFEKDTEAMESVLKFGEENNIKKFLTPFKRGSGTTMTKEEFAFEVEQAKKLLPQVPLEVVANVTDMVNKYGVEALGSWDQGVRYVVQNADKGTAYHETFHGVADLYLTDKQKQDIATENGVKKWNLKLEEQLADDFADYMYNKSAFAKFSDSVKRFFNGLVSWVTGARSSDYTRDVFNKIATKGYASKASVSSTVAFSKDRSLETYEDFENSLSPKEKVTLQKLKDKGRIKIVC